CHRSRCTCVLGPSHRLQGTPPGPPALRADLADRWPWPCPRWPPGTGPAYPGGMTAEVNAWVPGRAGKPVAREPDVAVALKRLAGAMADAEGNEAASAVQLADARWLLGDSAAKTIYAMQVRGELPMPGTAGWDELLALAAA